MRTSIFTLLLAPLAQAASSVILEETKAIPSGWTFLGNANASDTLTLFVALHEPGIDALKSKLHARQQPGHPSFGKHLSREEVNEHREPSESIRRKVSTWLKSGGVQEIQDQGSLLSFEATAKTVKTLFQADLGYYRHEDSGRPPVLRARSYSLPASLRESISFVHPLASFMPPRVGKSERESGQSTATTQQQGNAAVLKAATAGDEPEETSTDEVCTSTTLTTSTRTKATTTSPTLWFPSDPDPSNPFPNEPCLVATVPDCIKQLYNISYTPTNTSAPSPVRLGVAGFLEQYILHSDVSSFLTTLAPTLPPTYNFTISLHHNATNPQDSPHHAGLEASLDIQYALALGYPTNVIYYLTGGRSTQLDPATGTVLPISQTDNEPFLELLTDLLALPDTSIPHILSISYADDEPSVPRAYAERVCDLFAALTARGTTILAATGDGGAAGTGRSQCFDRETQQRRLVPTFPAGCPYVTAVGATENESPPLKGAVFSAGGFSEYFARPDWQNQAVGEYLAGTGNVTVPAVELFNYTGRAVPDISAIGAGFQIVMGGGPAQVLGTSASTPVMAAMVALVNDARMREGRGSLGWLNPRLYELAGKGELGLRDVVEGESAGCRFPGQVALSEGWKAGEGFDLVTGLGVLGDFGVFLGALMED
ncbi:tripeptidyl-peptidase-like protein [Chaetomium sp. MPI-SDFR-AT-0129]|nr:tripeptidyl-peptidase-like protein [Chaetomium sp. MPI-SDFR-AT-0129]